MKREVLQPGRVRIRHIRRGGPGAGTWLGQVYTPSWSGLNDQVGGWASGQYELRLLEEGTFSVVLPNTVGGDGILHRDRFLVITEGKRLPEVGAEGAVTYGGGTYRPGDEWLEVWWPDTTGELLWVGTPTKAHVENAAVQLQGADGYWCTRLQRETAAGYWHHAPRDVFEHYTQAWQAPVADDFTPPPTLVYDTAGERTTGDGLWAYRAADVEEQQPSSVALKPGSGGATGYIKGAYVWPVGAGGAGAHRAWRALAQARITGLPTGTALTLELLDAGTGAQLAALTLTQDAQGYTNAAVTITSLTAPQQLPGYHAPGVPGPYVLELQGRDRWVYAYLNGVALSVAPMPATSTDVQVRVALLNGPSDATTEAYIDNVVVWRTTPYLLGADPGDYHLPGAPVPGGLVGNYYDDNDFSANADRPSLVLNPSRQPYASRQDPKLDFAPIDPPAWMPIGNAYGRNSSVRWLGSIYLDLAAKDYALRLYGAPYARLWLGKTRAGEEYVVLDSATAVYATGAWLRSTFGSQSGWYPIVLEYRTDGSGAQGISLQWATKPELAYTVVPTTALSPQGCHQAQVRYDSHYDTLRALADTYGYQYVCEPRSWESGEFPGRLVPRVRVGRNTAYVLEADEATEYSNDITAEEVADAVVGEAQGLGDQDNKTSLVAEVYNYAELRNHAVVATGYEQLADVDFPGLLQQRLASVLALRGGAWEQLAAVSAGGRKLVDTFPLAGALATFAWVPGDALRVRLAALAVDDQSVRQIMGIQRAVYPDGLGRPSISFRQRPRNLRDTLRKVLRTALLQGRNYQGQIVALTGTLGGSSGTGATDDFTRVPLPADLARVVRATFVVQRGGSGSSWGIEVNGSNHGSFTAPGQYDVTPYVAQAAPGDPRMVARAVGGSGTVAYTLVLQVLV